MIKKWPVFIEPLNRETNLHIYLPDDYDSSQERYPVMYMFDGHNLFLDEDATYGKSWGLAEFMENYDKPFIIIGIECNHVGENRLQEYTPYRLENTFFGPAEGLGALLMHWIVYTLKPTIDYHLRTWPHREATGIAGSSMGGLMAFYGVMRYNNIFSKAACLSPSLFIAIPQLEQEMKAFMNPDTRIYLSFGTKELKGKANISRIMSLLECAEHKIEEKGGSCYINIVKDGKHSEASWERQSRTWFNFLWK